MRVDFEKWIKILLPHFWRGTNIESFLQVIAIELNKLRLNYYQLAILPTHILIKDIIKNRFGVSKVNVINFAYFLNKLIAFRKSDGATLKLSAYRKGNVGADATDIIAYRKGEMQDDVNIIVNESDENIQNSIRAYIDRIKIYNLPITITFK